MEKNLTWFTLKSVPGIGNHLFKKLIELFKTPEAIFGASAEDLLRIEGMTGRIVSSLGKYKIPDKVKRDYDLTMKRGYGIVTMSDPQYPPLLLEIPDPPPFLYVHGRLEKSIKNIAVVGSRNASSYGIETTKRLCSSLAARGITIVSGMARGIDTSAHKGALDGNGKTIAVLGSGFERVYPAENRGLFDRIAENGAVISEFPLHTEPEAYNFPIRNRIISGVSLGTIVVEATKKSGSLITARLAAEQNREVFAVPGNVQSFKSIGTHTLIKQGAKLVEHAQDVIEEFESIPGMSSGDINQSGEKEEDKLPPMTTSIEPGKLSGILLKLELMGLVEQAPGKLFSLKKDI